MRRADARVHLLWIGEHLGIIGRSDRRATLLLEMIERGVDRDAVDPGVERRLAFEGVQALEGLQEGLLRQVLELDRILDIVAQQREHARFMAFDKQLERALMARQRLAHQRGVVDRLLFHADHFHVGRLDARLVRLFPCR